VFCPQTTIRNTEPTTAAQKPCRKMICTCTTHGDGQEMLPCTTRAEWRAVGLTGYLQASRFATRRTPSRVISGPRCCRERQQVLCGAVGMRSMQPGHCVPTTVEGIRCDGHDKHPPLATTTTTTFTTTSTTTIKPPATTRHHCPPPPLPTTTTIHPHTHHIHCHRLTRSPAHARMLRRLTQYRLCPLSDDLTEECFKRTPIPFAGKTWLLWGDGTRMAINGTYLDEGTEPVNSTWAMNPLPFSDNSTGPEFAPPCDETVDRHVNDTGRCSGRFPYAVSIVDALVVPSDLSPGPYVLGFRYDCEATAQVWSSCADIDIV
jgi:hypothetical protein